MSEDTTHRRWCQRLLDVWVTFESVAGAEYDITDGQLIKAAQHGTHLEPGTRVRVNQQDDRRHWFEVWRIVSVDHVRPPGVMAGGVTSTTAA